MIKTITIEHFFSFGDKQTITLNSDTNILVGINGTGKSNFMKAIKLLYESVVGDGMEKILTQKWGGFTNVVNFSDSRAEEISITYEFDKKLISKLLNGKGHDFPKNPKYQIKIHKKGNLGDYYLSEWVYNESASQDQEPFNYLKIENGRGIISTRENAQISIKRLDVFKQNELVLRQISDPDMYFPLYTIKQAIEQIIVYNYFDTTFDSVIRQLSPFYAETKLLNDGRNLVHLLNYLSTTETNAYDHIVNLLRTHINPNFEDLRFMVQGSSKMLLSLKERGLSRTVTVDHISDGTLRFLLLLSIFYNPNRGSIICIDEPETGLHPDMINTVAKSIKYAAQNGSQIIIATHSPLLLNNFELEDLRIFDKDSSNQSFVSNITENNFPDWEGEFIVGQMWLRGQLGGVRW